MAYGRGFIYDLIREDLEKMKGKRTPVKVSAFGRMGAKKVPPSMLHVNPDDEFCDPKIGPNESIMSNYASVARRNLSLGDPVYEEPIEVVKLRDGSYMMLNGHHRWAGAIMAGMKSVRIHIENP